MDDSTLKDLYTRLESNRHIRSIEINPYNNTEALSIRYTEMPFELKRALNNNSALRIAETKVVPNRRGLYPEIEQVVIVGHSARSEDSETKSELPA